MTKHISVIYFAQLRERRGRSQEIVETSAATAGDLYQELQAQSQFPLGRSQLRVARNNDFATMDDPIDDGDTIAFIPPVAGG